MNIFLAILLSKFEGNDEIVKAPPAENKTSFASLALTIRNSLNIAKMAGSSPKKDGQNYAADGNGDEAKTTDKSKKSSVIKSTAGSIEEAHDQMVEGAQELVSDLSDKVKKAPKADDDFALCCFGPTAPLRKFCKDMTGNPKFDSTIMVIILFSSITLAYDNPMKSPERADVKFLMVLDYIFTIIFTF
jgi:voltage-dependent calcium channel L type alpha-1F